MNTPSPAPVSRRFGGPNSYGHLGELGEQRTPAQQGRTHVRVFLAKKKIDIKAVTPSSFSLRSKGCPVLDQGPTGSCTGHANAGAIYTTLAQNPATCIPIPSPLGIYTVGRCIDRAGTTPALTDSGANPDSVERGIAEFGITAMKGPTSDGRNSDCEPSTLNNEPDLGDLEKDAIFKLEGQYALDPTSPDFIPTVRAVLVAGYAVNFAVFVDTAFENWDPKSGPIGKPNTSDPNGGGHDLYCDGYHEVIGADGKVETVLDFANSWGTTQWGEAGYGEFGPAGYTPDASDPNVGWSCVYVMSVKPVEGSAPAPVAA